MQESFEMYTLSIYSAGFKKKNGGPSKWYQTWEVN